MSWAAAYPTISDDPEQLERLKKQFARLLLNDPDNPFKAGLALFQPDTGKAMYVADFWPKDPVVLAECRALLDEHGTLAFLPDKARVAREVYVLASNEQKPTAERLQSYRLYADMMGFIEPKTNINNGVINNNQGAKVMVIKDHGNAENWEKKAIDHQRKLQADAMADIEQR